MVGGASRRDESPVINSSNVFAALGSLKKKKKKPSEKEHTGSSTSKSSASNKHAEKEKEEEVFWAPAKLTVKSWADVDDDDDDDYYATTAPPDSVWSAAADSKVVKESDAEHAEEVKSFELGNPLKK